MTKLKVLEYPNPILKQISQEVDVVDEDLRKFMDDMVETMKHEYGVGLAAVQVGVLKRVIVIENRFDDEDDDDKKQYEILYLVNPKIIKKSDEKCINEEGCLSVPQMRAEVERSASIKIEYLDYFGNKKELETDTFLAVVIQHEMDHLDGVLYIDRISRLRRQMLIKKYEKNIKSKEQK